MHTSLPFIVQTDCDAVVKVLNEAGRNGSYLGHMIEDIKEFVEYIVYVYICV